MEKRIWTKPQAVIEQFTVNEYIAACGDQNKVYKFKCDAGGFSIGSVYQETNGVEGLQQIWESNPDTLLAPFGYHACGSTHEAPTSDSFVDGYFLTDFQWKPVIIWRGEDGNNIHCTTNLNINEWETAKS